MKKKKIKQTEEEKIAQKELSIEATAYHEAGHAAIAFILGQKFKKITIDKKKCKKGIRGMLEKYPRKPKDLSKTSCYKILQDLEPEILVSMAGHYAHRRYDPESANLYYSDEDMDYAIDLIHMVVIGRVSEFRISSTPDKLKDLIMKLQELYLHKLQDEIEILLSSPIVWKMVESIANALLHKKTLIWSEVICIIATQKTPDE